MEANTTINHEPAAFSRLIIRSAILGAITPSNEYKYIYLITIAVMLCLLFYGLEKFSLWALRKNHSITPLYLAAYRGAALYATLHLVLLDLHDLAGAMGAGLGGGVASYFLFKLEDKVIKLVSKKNSTIK